MYSVNCLIIHPLIYFFILSCISSFVFTEDFNYRINDFQNMKKLEKTHLKGIIILIFICKCKFKKAVKILRILPYLQYLEKFVRAIS